MADSIHGMTPSTHLRRRGLNSTPLSTITDYLYRERLLKKKEKSDLPFLRFFEIFRSDFRKYFNGVFGLRMQKNGQKRDKKICGKIRKEKSFFSSQLFRPKVFDMDFLNLFLVFLRFSC
jgi:hypothetical protein